MVRQVILNYPSKDITTSYYLDEAFSSKISKTRFSNGFLSFDEFSLPKTFDLR